MSANRYRTAPWMTGAPAHLRDDAAARAYEAELAAEIAKQVELLRLALPNEPLASVERFARGRAMTSLMLRETAERGAQRRSRTVASGGGQARAAKQRAAIAERIAAERARLTAQGYAPHTHATRIAKTVKRSAATVRRYLAKLPK
jgi:hypothetical protein